MKVQFNIKIEQSDLKLVHKIAEKRGQTVSDFTRITIRQELARLGFLKQDNVKALGVAS